MTSNPSHVPERSGEPGSRRSGTASIAIEAFEGPIPPPAVLEAYERLVPGAAERILKMAENQSNHRQEIEKIVVRAGARDSLLGVVVACVVVICSFGWSAYALSKGQSAKAVAVVISTVAGLAGVFVYGKHATKQERLERARLNKPTPR